MCASFGLAGYDLFPDDVLPDWDRYRADLEQLGPPPDTIRPTGPKALNFSPIITSEGAEPSWWGLWVGGQPGKYSTFNAKLERLTTGIWKRPFAQARAVVPATRYFEYRDDGGKKKQRYAFRLPDRSGFFFAGVTAPIYGEGLPRTSYAIVTRPPTDRAAEVHNRMPLILPPSFIPDWLDPATTGDDGLREAALAASEELAEQFVYEAA